MIRILFTPAFAIMILISTSFTTSYDLTDQVNNESEVNDGPYIFIDSDSSGILKSIRNGEIVTDTVALKKTSFANEPSEFAGADKIAILSDIHGQIDVLQELLKANDIIDQKNNWSFDKGHFVIVGDVFDRGPKVTETLWFIFKLEEQAELAGGKVHYLMGNHEYMALHNDLRYIHEKYYKTSELLNTSYPDLFSVNTVLGRWLRSKSTIIKINDNLFVHGGLSNEFMSMGLSLDEANDRYRKSFEMTRDEIRASEDYNGLYSSSSPIWYRGYFAGKKGMTESDFQNILSFLDANQIIVGHTSYKKVKSGYDKRLYVVDSSIKIGKSGELLLIENGKYYRCKFDGKRKLLN